MFAWFWGGTNSITQLLSGISRLENGVAKMALNLQVLTDEVAQARTVTDSAIVLIGTIAAELAILRATITDPDAQAKIDALAAALDRGTEDLAVAISANTPAAPTA
jgi:hypothetical protein